MKSSDGIAGPWRRVRSVVKNLTDAISAGCRVVAATVLVLAVVVIVWFRQHPTPR